MRKVTMILGAALALSACGTKLGVSGGPYLAQPPINFPTTQAPNASLQLNSGSPILLDQNGVTSISGNMDAGTVTIDGGLVVNGTAKLPLLSATALVGTYGGTAPVMVFTAAGLDIKDSGVQGSALAGLVEVFFDGGEIDTTTALATVTLPYTYADAGFTVDCKHANGQLGLTEGPVELGTAYYCIPTAANKFSVYGGPTPLGTTALGTITHDAGPGLVMLQYETAGW